MEQTVTRGEETVVYTVRKNARAKRAHIRIGEDAQVSVTLPKRYALREAERMVRMHFDWVQGKVREFEKKKVGAVVVPTYAVAKEEARMFITERTKYYAELMGLTYKSISIRNQKTRWGSCSPSGALNFSYKLLYLPLELADYVIVHELCHLQELNHSRRFWKLVEGVVPQWRALRARLHASPLRSTLPV